MPDRASRHPFTWRREAFKICLATLLAMAALYVLFSDDKTDFTQVGLGSNGRSVYAERGTLKIHCQSPWDCLPSSANLRQYAWLGASQLHVIMRDETGDRTAADLLNQALAPHGIDLQTYSVGNANFQELLLMFETLVHQRRIDSLILGLVFDDLKEEEIHPGVVAVLDDPGIVAELRESPTGRAILGQLAKIKARLMANDVTLQRLAPTVEPKGDGETSPQIAAEAALSDWLKEHSELWRLRDAARGHLFIGLSRLHDWLLQLRYRLLGRPIPVFYTAIPEGIRHLNQAALVELAELARRHHVRLIVYVAPRPRSVFFPYDPASYENFKEEARQLILKNGGTFANLEDAVSDPAWGTIYNGKGETAQDIFHFDAQGHREFAAALLPLLKPADRP